MAKVEDLIGKILSSVTGSVGDDEIIFTTDDGRSFKMHHYQDCCESVTVEDIVGNLEDLVGVPIVKASEDSSEETPEGIKKTRQRRLLHLDIL